MSKAGSLQLHFLQNLYYIRSGAVDRRVSLASCNMHTNYN